MTTTEPASEATPEFPPAAQWRILEHFEEQAHDDVVKSIRGRMETAVRTFSALSGETINVGILFDRADANAQAFGYQRTICLPPEEHTTNITLWHELGHVAIRVRYERDEDVPRTSEEFCSIFSVARMPPTAIDEDRIPYLGEPTAPREEWPEICRRALAYREDHHQYIQQCKEWLGT